MPPEITPAIAPLIRRCLDMQDDELALSCLKTTLSQMPKDASCRPRLILFTQEGCPPCHDEKIRLQADLDSGLILEVNLGNPDGRALAEKNGIDFAPALVLLDCNGNLIV